MTLTLALFAPSAHACEHVRISGPGGTVEVDDCDRVHHEDDEDDDDAPAMASISDDEGGRDALQLQYGMQFLPDAPGHDLQLRLVGERDAYLSGELRYLPAGDVIGVGRLSAGFDVFGQSDWDLTLGLFLGTAGEWDRQIDRAVLYAAPIAGTEIGVGYEGRRLIARYRWLAGFGAGPVDEMLTENEITVGYRVLPRVHAIGQYLVLSPGELDDEHGVGLGVRVSL